MNYSALSWTADTYRLLYRHFGFLISKGWIWILVSAVAAGWLGVRLQGLLPIAWYSDVLTQLLQMLVRSICFAAIAVPWHRHVLISVPDLEANGWRLVPMYGVAALAIELVFTTAWWFPGWLDQSNDETPDWLYAIWVVSGLAAYYVMSRLALVLPAIALGRNASVAAAWHSSTNSGWRLVVAQTITILAAFLATFALWSCVLAILFYTVPTPFKSVDFTMLPQSVPWAIALELSMFLVALVAIAFLTVVYRDLVLRREPLPTPPG